MNSPLYVLALLALVACAAQTRSQNIRWDDIDYGLVKESSNPLNNDR